MPFFSKIQKYTVFQCKNKKKEVLSWPPLFFSPVKHLHASCFPTHNAVQDSRLFELWLHCLGERWEHCVVYVHVHTHQYHSVSPPVQMFTFNLFTTSNNGQLEPSMKIYKKKTNNGLPFESVLKSKCRKDGDTTASFLTGFTQIPMILGLNPAPTTHVLKWQDVANSLKVMISRDSRLMEGWGRKCQLFCLNAKGFTWLDCIHLKVLFFSFWW